MTDFIMAMAFSILAGGGVIVILLALGSMLQGDGGYD